MATVAEIRGQLAKAIASKKDLEETRELFAPQEQALQAQLDFARQQFEAARAIYEASRAGMADFKSQVKEWDLKIGAKIEEIEKLERLLHRAAQEEAARHRLFDQMEAYEEVARNAPWYASIKKHQLDGAKQMAAMQKGILGDKRGVGKTLTSIAYADLVGAKRLLVLAPRKTAINFRKELLRWAPHRAPLYFVGADKLSRDAVLKHMAAVGDLMPTFTVVINLEAWSRDPELVNLLAHCRFDTVIVDEAHNIKNTRSAMFKGTKNIIHRLNRCPSCGSGESPTYDRWTLRYTCPSCGESSHEDNHDWYSVRNVLLMTGSPVMNRPNEMWPLLNLTDPKGFPKEKTFIEEFLYYDRNVNDYVWGVGAEEKLVEKLGMRYLARTQEDAGIERLPVSEEFVEIEFTKETAGEQWDAYWKMHDEFEAELESGETMKVAEVIAQLQRLQSILLWPPSVKIYGTERVWNEKKQEFQVKSTKEVVDRINVHHSIVLDEAEKLINELVGDGERVVVFCKRKDPLFELQNRLLGIGSFDVVGTRIKCATLTGDTPMEQAEAICTDFDMRTYEEQPWRERGFDVLLTTYQAGGESLNFTDASCVILLDPHYNPERRSQAIGRVDRFGQKHSVKVYDFSVRVPGENSRRTVYEWLEAINARKKNLIESFENEANIAQEILREVRAGRGQ